MCNPSVALLMHAMLEIQKFGPKNELCLIPFVPAIVIDVDYKTNSIYVDPPNGLLDLTYIEIKKIVIRGFLPLIAIGLTEEERTQLSPE